MHLFRMVKSWGIVIAVVLLIAIPVRLLASTPVVADAPLIALAATIAYEHHVNVDHFLKVINCESEWDPNVRSEYTLPDGTYENSWGIAQWNLDENSMTKEQALDPRYALTKMAEAWQTGKAGGWECYRLWDARGWK